MVLNVASVGSGQINFRQLAIFLVMGLGSLFFWLTPVLYPLKIFAVFNHETFHALATVLAGAHYIVDFLAVTSSLYALYDLTDFLWFGTRTDSVILAEITSVPAFIWALLWSGVSLSVVYLAAKRAVTTH